MEIGPEVVVPAINQVEVHPWLPRWGLRKYSSKTEIAVVAESPLVRGRKECDEELMDLKQRCDMLPAEILLKWSYIQGFVVLTKSANKARMKQNIEILPERKEPANPGEESIHPKVKLRLDIFNSLDKPFSHRVFTWGGRDPTEFWD